MIYNKFFSALRADGKASRVREGCAYMYMQYKLYYYNIIRPIDVIYDDDEM